MNTFRTGPVHSPSRFGDPASRHAEDETPVNALRRPRAQSEACFGPAVAGSSAAVARLRSQITRIAPYYRTALLTGPQGTAKVGIARMLHAFSPCAGGEFVACEATALAEAMLREDGRAVLEAVGGPAIGGTLFLDDVGEVPPALQGALLRIWAARRRIRVVAATHRDLRTMGITGQFRPDLAQRLMGVEIAAPPLHARPEDLEAVIQEVLRGAGLTLSDEALERMKAHTWPGDIAELEKALWDAARTADGAPVMEAAHLPVLLEANDGPDPAGSMERLEDVVQQHVLGVLTRCGGNKLRAAEVLGISRSTLYRMLETCVGQGYGPG
ncbi:two-component system, NtrC family, response regulator HydG [Granulicella pectinivorans]|uniref:Two-component system, NtrC family, response regulator HydG n=1 Tax=Granulicella pectinivorans TaxID=474950 RepID=A0A1I6MSH6_9BACT|nr:sigma 54-interacting transcriptional regulator [Granulicella pectinivorans]SFS18478.1 two-component system, NtrC family, response regulator HydG [Granulicella pectinivorans]